jgi:hypothetical protein
VLPDLLLAALALIANLACWRKVMVLWRALPRPDDDDQGWAGWWDGDSPLDPRGGPSGIKFDWTRFERDFWAHVKEKERQCEHELIRAFTRPVAAPRTSAPDVSVGSSPGIWRVVRHRACGP